MKVLVTGGAGFIGSHVAEAAMKAGHEVAVIDNLSKGKRENVGPGIDFHEVDIRDQAAVLKLARDFGPDVVSHHAAQASVSASVREPQHDAEVNINGSLIVAEAARREGSRLVFASTGGALYGEVPRGEQAGEETPVCPLSPYACSKASFELYLGAFAAISGLNFTILRYANVYGPRQDPHGEAGVVAIFVERLLRGQPIQINARASTGDDGCIRDYVFVGDAVRANLAAFEGRLDRRTLNIGTGVGTTTRVLAERIAGLVVGPVAMLDGEYRAGDLQRSVLDPSMMLSVLGEPTPLEKGLEATTEWFRHRMESGS